MKTITLTTKSFSLQPSYGSFKSMDVALGFTMTDGSTFRFVLMGKDPALGIRVQLWDVNQPQKKMSFYVTPEEGEHHAIVEYEQKRTTIAVKVIKSRWGHHPNDQFVTIGKADPKYLVNEEKP